MDFANSANDSIITHHDITTNCQMVVMYWLEVRFNGTDYDVWVVKFTPHFRYWQDTIKGQQGPMMLAILFNKL